MLIAARQIAAYVVPDMVPVPVFTIEGHHCFDADSVKLLELAEAGHIWGIVRGRLKRVGLMVPLAEVHTDRARQRAGSVSDAIAQDCRTIQRGRDITALDFQHNQRVCSAYADPLRRRQLADHRKAARTQRAARQLAQFHAPADAPRSLAGRIPLQEIAATC